VVEFHALHMIIWLHNFFPVLRKVDSTLFLEKQTVSMLSNSKGLLECFEFKIKVFIIVSLMHVSFSQGWQF